MFHRADFAAQGGAMQSEEFVAAWNVRRHRQIVISVVAPLFILALVGTFATADLTTKAHPWQLVVMSIGALGIVASIVASIMNARCPNCGALKGSGIFWAPRCSKCSMP
jgi:hypothetical protein